MIYLDNCATTPLDPAAAAEMARVSREAIGNPSSIHSAGRRAAKILGDARRVLADTICARPREIVICSSGTEANNFVLSSVIRRFAREGVVQIVTTATEHASIENYLAYEEKSGTPIEVARVGVDSNGRLNPDALCAAVTPETRLLSVLHCNNETGVLQDTGLLFSIKNNFPRLLLHLDIAQSYMKWPFDVRTMPMDFLTTSAHKVYGPKGIAFVYVRDGVEAPPLIVGGAQEEFRRAGTENVSAVAGFARAVQAIPPPANLHRHFIALENAFFDTLKSFNSDYTINGPSDYARRIPGIFNISFPGVKNKEDLQIALDLEGVLLSSTSACHSGVVTDSHVLRAMSVPGGLRAGSVRIAFNRFHTADEIQSAAITIAAVARRMAN